ncbi:MAG: PEGA domain-containing protein, partial [Myxococcales bacterium]|nr:PEGA domain-containing protein [Myxococcales bacterium]
MMRLGFSCLLLLLFSASVARADGKVAMTLVTVSGDSVDRAEFGRLGIGIRNGVRELPGLTYEDVSTLLSPVTRDQEVAAAVTELDVLAEGLRDGRASKVHGRIQEIRRLFEERLEYVRRSVLVDAYMLDAIANCERKRRVACSQGFAEVIAFREGVTYDPDRYPLRHREIFEGIRTQMISEAVRETIEITTEPTGAEVFVDGRSYGPSPAIVTGLLPGPHYVTARTLGFLKKEERIEVGKGAVKVAHVDLLPNDRALLLEKDLPRVEQELGQPRAGRAI